MRARFGGMKRYRRKYFPVEIAVNKHSRMGLPAHLRKHQYIFIVEREKIRTFQDAAVLRALEQYPDILPVQKIFRRKKQYFPDVIFAGAADHIIYAAYFCNFGVPEIAAAIRREPADYGIICVFFKMQPVFAYRDGLGLPELIGNGRIKQIQQAVFYHRAPGPAAAIWAVVIKFVGVKRYRQFFPINQIVAYGVAPVHCPPFRRVRVMLKERVIFIFIKN